MSAVNPLVFSQVNFTAEKIRKSVKHSQSPGAGEDGKISILTLYCMCQGGW